MRVTLDNGRLQVAHEGNPGEHRFVIEPIYTNGFSWRVRRTSGFAPEPGSDAQDYVSSDPDCNDLFDDVVCGGSRAEISITMGPSNDTLFLREQGLLALFPLAPLVLAPTECVGNPPDRGPPLTVTLDAGNGDDFVAVFAVGPCPAGEGRGVQQLRLVADGGVGADFLQGGNLRDSLRGGPGADVLEGGAEGDEALYDEKTNPVTVTIGVGADDGEAGEGDFVRGSVEHVSGGHAGDTLSGNDAINNLQGNRGSDTLRGNAGNDILSGDAGRDMIFGGADRDNLRGDDDDDTIDSREPAPPAVADVIGCGEGPNPTIDSDLLLSDLEDPRPRDCELIKQFALDDGPPGSALQQRLRVRRDSKVAVRVACPRQARVPCRGVLTLRDAKSRRVLGRARYTLGLGTTRSVQVSVRRGLPSRVIAEMKEQGVSKKGPRFSSRLLLVST